MSYAIKVGLLGFVLGAGVVLLAWGIVEVRRLLDSPPGSPRTPNA